MMIHSRPEMIHSHQTAPTQFVEANGIRFAYRRFGKSGGIPLVFNQHFTGTIDHWDPAVTDGLAATREVILFNNAGISSTSGEVPASVEEMAVNAAAFIRALGLARVDVLGFSLGGLVAQEITLQASDLVRRLVLVGTGPRSGEGMAALTPEAQEIFGATYDEPDHLWLRVHFTRSEKSQAAGREFLKRFRLRAENRDPEVNEKVAPAQIEAISKWGAPREKPFEYLKSIRQPTLVINGSNDVIIYTVNSFILQQNLPNAQLILYPDSNHGSQYQYPTLFVADVARFLDAEVPFPTQKVPRENEVTQTVEEENKAFVLEAFETLFNKRDYAAAERFWSRNYIQHSAHIPPGREGLFALVKGTPDSLHYENGLTVANGDYVLLHGRFTGMGLPANWIVVDIVRLENGQLAEHWDVIEDEATKEASVSGLPMFGTTFPSG